MDNREDVGEYYPGGTVVPAKPEPSAHPVESVNGKVGAVVLTAEDVGALPATAAIGGDVYHKSKVVNGVQHYKKEVISYDDDMGDWGASYVGDYIIVGGVFVPA